MMYPFMTLDKDIEVVHSQLLANDRVKVYFEQPVCGGFKSAVCYLPEYKWEDVVGFTSDGLSELQNYLESTAHLIYRFSKEGGFGGGQQVVRLF